MGAQETTSQVIHPGRALQVTLAMPLPPTKKALTYYKQMQVSNG